MRVLQRAAGRTVILVARNVLQPIRMFMPSSVRRWLSVVSFQSPDQMERDGASELKQDERQAMIQGAEAYARQPLREQADDQQEDRGDTAQRSQQQKEQDGRMVVD
jgi:hypothetical protein